MQDGNTYVSILLDGDGMLVGTHGPRNVTRHLPLLFKFLDDLVEKKDRGGQEAAQRLLACSRQYLQDAPLELNHDIKIFVAVCCNIKGTSKLYVEQKILDKTEDFAHFVRGFNMGNPLCLMVDAGSGKECSDHKLRGMPDTAYPGYQSFTSFKHADLHHRNLQITCWPVTVQAHYIRWLSRQRIRTVIQRVYDGSAS